MINLTPQAGETIRAFLAQRGLEPTVRIALSGG